MKQLVLVLFFSLYTIQGFSQKIVGRIVDQHTGRPIPDVKVFFGNDSTFASSNYLGFFELENRDHSLNLYAHHVSYADVKIDLGKQEKILFSMERVRIELAPLTICDYLDAPKSDSELGGFYDEDTQNNYQYAMYTGGKKALYNYIGQNFKSDKEDDSIGDFITVNFTIAKDGSVVNVRTSNDSKYSEQFKTLFQNMKEWSPALQDTTKVEQDLTILIGYGECVYLVVDQSATFTGGLDKFYEYADSVIASYPKKDLKNGKNKKVYLQFVVKRDGNISSQSISIMQGLGNPFDSIAMDIVRKSSAWIPATTFGKQVNQRLVIPIFFK